VTKNIATLERTQAGRELRQAVNHWSSGGNETMRIGAQKWMTGKERLTIGSAPQETGAKLAEAVSVAPRMKEPTFRGMRVDKTISETEKEYTKGMVFDSQISSFSIDAEAAGNFAGAGAMEGQTSLVYNLEVGARGLNVQGISSYIGEAERIVAGRFEVLGTRRVVGPHPHTQIQGTVLHVDIRQINTLVKEVK
jgi:hypothetical protein